jgi:hypothetical protein
MALALAPSPVATLWLLFPKAFAPLPVATLLLPVPLAFVPFPVAVFALGVVLVPPEALADAPVAVLPPPSPEALEFSPVALLALPAPLATAAAPVAVFTLPSPCESAALPVATFELLLLPLAFAWFPTAVFAPGVAGGVVAPLALALGPQATLPALPATVAPAPLCGSPPSVLPPHTNCACACGTPKHDASIIASAMATEETNDNPMQRMTAPPLA